MKSYKEVIEERYDGREKDVHIYNNRYSLINPVGFYSNEKIRKAFYKIFNYFRRNGIDITKLKILDVGCGAGGHCRFMAELINDPSNIHGIDLSRVRIESAKKMNPAIVYKNEDLLSLNSSNEYDVITALVVFLHFASADEVATALRKIHSALKPGGFFVWHEIYARDHFKTKEIESEGYAPAQMDRFCRESGFSKAFSLSLFRKAGRYNSFFLYQYLPSWMVVCLEWLLFFLPPGIIITVYKK